MIMPCSQVIQVAKVLPRELNPEHCTVPQAQRPIQQTLSSMVGRHSALLSDSDILQRPMFSDLFSDLDCEGNLVIKSPCWASPSKERGFFREPFAPCVALLTG